MTTWDAERLATIIRSRLGNNFEFADDSGTDITRLDADGLAIRLVHLYLTGDVRSGLAPLPPSLARTGVHASSRPAVLPPEPSGGIHADPAGG